MSCHRHVWHSHAPYTAGRVFIGAGLGTMALFDPEVVRHFVDWDHATRTVSVVQYRIKISHRSRAFSTGLDHVHHIVAVHVIRQRFATRKYNPNL